MLFRSRRLAEFEECQTFLNEGRAYTLYKMPTREGKPRSFPAPRPADPNPEATA